MEPNKETPEIITQVPQIAAEAGADAVQAAGVQVEQVNDPMIITGIGTEAPLSTLPAPEQPEPEPTETREQFLGISNAHLSPVRMAQLQQNQEMFSAMSAAMSAAKPAETPPREEAK